MSPKEPASTADLQAVLITLTALIQDMPPVPAAKLALRLALAAETPRPADPNGPNVGLIEAFRDLASAVSSQPPER